MENITRDDGLTDAEGIVADALVDAANAFGALPKQHPDEGRDFCDAVHRLQDLLAMRIARRVYPKGWPDKSAPVHPGAAGTQLRDDLAYLRITGDGADGVERACAFLWGGLVDSTRTWAEWCAEDPDGTYLLDGLHWTPEDFRKVARGVLAASRGVAGE